MKLSIRTRAQSRAPSLFDGVLRTCQNQPLPDGLRPAPWRTTKPHQPAPRDEPGRLRCVGTSPDGFLTAGHSGKAHTVGLSPRLRHSGRRRHAASLTRPSRQIVAHGGRLRSQSRRSAGGVCHARRNCADETRVHRQATATDVVQVHDWHDTADSVADAREPTARMIRPLRRVRLCPPFRPMMFGPCSGASRRCSRCSPLARPGPALRASRRAAIGSAGRLEANGIDMDITRRSGSSPHTSKRRMRPRLETTTGAPVSSGAPRPRFFIGRGTPWLQMSS